MTFDKELLSFKYLKELNKGLTSEGNVVDKFGGPSDTLQTNRRLLSANDNSFDLSEYLEFEVVRAAEDSAPIEKLGFTVTSQGIDGDQLRFMVLFANPSLVSIGSIQDELHISVIDPSFFSDSESGQNPTSSRIINLLPRMLDS